MPVWRCPHCHTPQTESSRCWVCRRSTTSCVTCKHYRKGVAGGLGLCGRDPRRLALKGTEMRPCWVAAPTPVEPEPRWTGSTYSRVPGDAVLQPATAIAAGTTTPAGVAVFDPRGSRKPRTFVPVDELGAGLLESAGDEAPAAAPAPVTRMPGTWWLWGDPEPWPEG